MTTTHKDYMAQIPGKGYMWGLQAGITRKAANKLGRQSSTKCWGYKEFIRKWY